MKSVCRRFQAPLLAAVCLAVTGLGAKEVKAQKALAAPASPDPAAIEFLLASATKDFKSLGSKRPTSIRETRVGYMHEADKGGYLLCGSFQQAGESGAPWIPFATIKTSDYEQWLGGLAQAICARQNITWYAIDHAESLMQRVHAP